MFLSPVKISNQQLFNFQWEVGSLAIFLAWFNLLIYMQRFYFFGIYVVMFIEILKTLIKVIFLFSILLIGFGLVFFILLANDVRTKQLYYFEILIVFPILGVTSQLNTIYFYLSFFYNDDGRDRRVELIYYTFSD